MGKIIRVFLDIPGWLYKPLIFIVLLYRRIRYGYGFRKIPLTKGKFAIVDPEDYERLSKYKWRVCIGRHTCYAQRAVKVGGKWTSVMMHRAIIKVGPGKVVDHINHNGLDNRKANLRAATVAQNAWNRRRKKNRFAGVTWNKQIKKWRAAVSHNGISEHIGCFDSEIEAAKAYDKAAMKYHGEFASINFKSKKTHKCSRAQDRKQTTDSKRHKPGIDGRAIWVYNRWNRKAQTIIALFTGKGLYERIEAEI